MKKAVFLACLCCTLFSCSNVEKKAGEKLRAAREAFQRGDYSEAKIQIDSIKILYPKAFETRREGIGLMQQVELKEQEKTLVYLDSMLQDKQKEVDALKKNYTFEKDAEYQRTGNYLHPSQVIEKNLHRSYLRFQVDETGVMSMTSIYCGPHNIHHLAVKVTAPDGSFAADGIVFTVGSTYELSVQWTADGVTTNETLGTVDFNDEMTEPQIIWGAVSSSLDFGYSVQRVGNKQYRLTLTCYPVEVQVDAPPWMQPAQVEIDLRLNGDAGEPTATAVLDCEGESGYGNSSRTESVWNGTFYSEDVVNGWEYDGETLPKYVVRMTDTNGDVWTEEMPLSKR